jgi:hypothetical protein
LVSLIAKTKRIAERSDTNCDTHTDRQSTLDKYMVNSNFSYRFGISYWTGEKILKKDLAANPHYIIIIIYFVFLKKHYFISDIRRVTEGIFKSLNYSVFENLFS